MNTYGGEGIRIVEVEGVVGRGGGRLTSWGWRLLSVALTEMRPTTGPRTLNSLLAATTPTAKGNHHLL